MRNPRIHCPQPLHGGATITLAAEASHHIGRVLRMQAGQPLTLFNGDGSEYPATIAAVDKRQVTVTLGEALLAPRASPLAVHLGIAISKGERMDWVIQKATELGVAQITPLDSERVEVRLHGERADKKLAHWSGIAVAACEQSARNRLPLLEPIQPLEQWLAQVQAQCKYVLDHRSAQPLDTGAAKPDSVALLIGPEGGLSEREIDAARRHGFSALQLGPRVLRTETAPLAALSILQFLWGDLGA